uniref:Solute carrier organic anion transporter family member n=3 Tax=Lygus hesperus TaxID=30085 RepID=A0A0A9XNJ6_LYGHE
MTEKAFDLSSDEEDNRDDEEEDPTKVHVEKVEASPNETKCGFLGCYTPWMQKLASKKVFLVVYGLLGMNQAASGSYFVATLTTFEKRFKLPSTYSGMTSSAWDVGGLMATMVIAYYGSSGHKTRWVAYWAVLAAISCIVRITPHLIYGPGIDTFKTAELLNSTQTSQSDSIYKEKDPLCMSPFLNEENCSLNEEGTVAFAIVIATQVLCGIGTSAYYTLGAAYLDDNVTKNKFPLLFAVAACMRYVGPTLGYLLASYTLKQYINADVTPNFGLDDSRWIGAWHLGWIPLAVVEFIMAIAMAFFPRTLPREAIRRQNSQIYSKPKKHTSIDDFMKTVKRLFNNRILMFNTFSTTFYIFGLMGYWIFMPKYIETQFRKTAADASVITGTVGLACTAIGIISSGAIVSRLKPRPKYLAFWNLVTEAVDVLGTIMFAFIGCQKDDMHGSVGLDGSWLLNSTCNSQCACSPTIPYTPVCSEDGSQMYFSACHAGCLESGYINGSNVFQNCSCVPGSGVATPGPCPVDCATQFYIFLALLSFMKFLSSTGRAGNTIIQYRSVAPEDKSVSIAFTEISLCAITFIPSPVLFGIIVDASCQVWGYTCGEKGNCLLYYGQDLRYSLNFTSAAFLFIGFLLDVGVFCNVDKLKIYDDEDTNQELEETTKQGKDKTNQILLLDNKGLNGSNGKISEE